MNSIRPITVDLAMAKKLREAGWLMLDDSDNPHTTYFYWVSAVRSEQRGGGREYVLNDSFWEQPHSAPCLPAPTAEEILRRLPINMEEGDYWLNLCPQAGGVGWFIAYMDLVKGRGFYKGSTFQADSLANAAAAMWCYLKENNLLPAQ